MSANPKPDFTPTKPATYTPHSGKPAASQPATSQPATSQPDREHDESADRRPGAPERPDVPDRSNPPMPMDLNIEDAGAQADTKDIAVEEADSVGPRDRPGEDRNSNA